MQNITHLELETYIEEQVVLPNIQSNVESLMRNKTRWQRVSTVSETLSQIFMCIATILSFSSGIYSYQILSFLAGVSNIISLLLLLFSNYSDKKSRQCIVELEKIPILNLMRQRV